jgi:hypothetical protein
MRTRAKRREPLTRWGWAPAADGTREYFRIQTRPPGPFLERPTVGSRFVRLLSMPLRWLATKRSA